MPRLLPFISLVVTIYVVFFGDNIYQQKTGHSFLDSSPTHTVSELPAAIPLEPTATPEPPIATATPILLLEPSITPTSAALPVEIVDAKGVHMRLVPAGEFIMGSNDSEYSNEKPAHTVLLDSFYIDKYEVTNALYKGCVNAGGCGTPSESKSYTRASYYGNSQFDNYPVIYVDWNQAKIYCEWRGARLPSEAEWEKAACGTDGRAYPWGNDTPNKKLANYSLNVGDTTAVGNYEGGKSPYGVYDMAGNVWEWVNDGYDGDYYASSPAFNPPGPASGSFRVVRGGSWLNYPDNLRVSSRNWYAPDYWDYYFGFRCAR